MVCPNDLEVEVCLENIKFFENELERWRDKLRRVKQGFGGGMWK